MGHEVQMLLKEVLGEETLTNLEKKEKRLVKELWG